MTAAIVWMVLWFVFMWAAWVFGWLSLVHGSIFAGMFGKARLIILTVPLGLASLVFAVYSLVHVILQVISVIQIATA